MMEADPLAAQQRLDLAILEVLASCAGAMPSSLVGALRCAHDANQVRPALARMLAGHRIAALGHTYCLPHQIDDLRANYLDALHAAAGKFGQLENGAARLDQQRRLLEEWTGWEDRQ